MWTSSINHCTPIQQQQGGMRWDSVFYFLFIFFCPVRYAAQTGVTSLSSFGHRHGNSGARQIYFAPIHLSPSVSMNMISGFFIIRLRRLHAWLRACRFPRWTWLYITSLLASAGKEQPEGDLIHTDASRSVQAKSGRSNKGFLLDTLACKCASPCRLQSPVDLRDVKTAHLLFIFFSIFFSCIVS